MWQFLLLFLVVLTACSEKVPSAAKSKHSKEPTTQSTAAASANAIPKASTHTVNMPLIRDKVSVEAKDAFLNLYGGATWSDKSIGDYFKDKTGGYITPKFEGRFTEGGIDKLLVLGYITTEPLEDFLCHACVPLIGGAIFKQQDSKWVIDSVSKVIGWGDVLETGDFNLVQLGPDKYGVLMHITDAHQGYEDDRFEIIVPYKGSLTTALVDGFYEEPGDAAYPEGKVELLPQDLNIKFVPGKNPEYFDAVIRGRFNDGDAKHFIRKDVTNRYQFHDGKFKPI